MVLDSVSDMCTPKNQRIKAGKSAFHNLRSTIERQRMLQWFSSSHRQPREWWRAV